MPSVNERSAVRDFVKRWTAPDMGDEKRQTQSFWIELLQSLFGLKKTSPLFDFEKPVELDHVSFIDAFIKDTKVLIEQKSANIDLDKPAKQSDGQFLTPFQQAKRYYDWLPSDQRGRWIVVCNFREIRIHDMRTPKAQPLVVLVKDLEKSYPSLRFLISDRAEAIQKELELSVAAGELVGEIYDALLEQYGEKRTDPAYLKSLNILCVRLVFCLYAEDAGLFGAPMRFHDYLRSFPAERVRTGLIDLFAALDTPISERDEFMDADLMAFPYVNGGLFADKTIKVPRFTPEIVDLILKRAAEGFDWSAVSPTIFGAVFESTLNPETRRQGGMHYTSIENIRRVIGPLFMDRLREEFAEIVALPQRTSAEQSTRERQLRGFQDKLASMRFLDPACGSGNFLTETFCELRRLENDVLRELTKGQAIIGAEGFNPVKVGIRQFYGIEINDFACAVAAAALWIAESQTLRQTGDIFDCDFDFLPLKTFTNIHEGNALRMDWNEVIASEELSYIIGNPPFVGARYMSKEQKQDVFDTFGEDWPNVGDLDYVSCWFKKSAEYIGSGAARAALVATNSICQGQSVANLWRPLMNDLHVHIDFAWTTFVWDSEASGKAHVHCVIVGFSTGENSGGRIFSPDGTGAAASNINGYLLDGPNVFIDNRSKPLCDVPEVGIGNKPIDGGHYLFTEEEKDAFIAKEPDSAKLFRRWYGAEEFINGKVRYCLWLGDCSVAELAKLPRCRERVEAVRQFRLASKSAGTRKIADKPRRFHVENMPSGTYILVPKVSSERREYIPMGFMSPEVLCSDLVFLIPDASLFHFGVLTSRVHMAWMRAVAGRLEMRYRYSAKVVYNNFIWPEPTAAQKAAVEKAAQGILDARAAEEGATMANLYDTALMPPELRQAHRVNDKAVMKAYGFDPDMTEAEIVAKLMKLYEARVSAAKS